MATYTISPVPVSGGTMSITDSRAHWTHLGGDKYLIVYQQTSPNHIFAQVVNYNGVSTAPTLGPARLIRQSVTTTPATIRVYGAGSGKAVVFYHTTGTGIVETQFISIDGSDNITEGTVTTLLTGAPSSTSLFNVFKLSDTTLRLVYQLGASSSITYVQNMTVAASTETLTLGTATQLNVNNFNYCFYRPIPGTTNYFESVIFSTFSAVSIIDPAGQTVSTIDASAWNYKTVYPASTSRFFFAQSGSTYARLYAIDNNVWPANPVNCATVGMPNVSNVLPLDEHHAMAVYEGGAGLSAMVLRLLSSGIGDASPATNKANGLALKLGGLGTLSYWNSRMFYPHQRDASTYVYWFMTGSGVGTKIGYKTIYQPAS